MNQVVIMRYGVDGKQTKGYNKALTAMQQFEECLISFEKYVCKKYEDAIAQAPEPSWWARNIQEMPKEVLFAQQSDENYGLSKLFKWIERDSLTEQPNWLWMEQKAFNGKVDVARHYKAYDDLRQCLRCGEMWMLDSDACRFINSWNKRLTIFK